MSAAEYPGAFSVDPARGFAVTLGGTVVATPTDPRVDPAAKVITEKNGLTVLGDGIRKEFAFFEDRLEYTFDFSMPPAEPKEMTLLLPLPPEATATIVSGRTYTMPRERTMLRTKELAGVKAGTSYAPAQYVTVKAPGYALSVDTFPAGAGSEDPSYAESPLRIFAARPTPNGVEIAASVYTGYSGYGSHIKGKIIFYSDGRPYEQAHPFIWANEYGALEKSLQLSFAPKARTDGVPVAGAEAYSPARKRGWTSGIDALKLHSTALNSPLHGSHIASGEPAAFRIDTPAGYYYLTLNFGSAEGPAGPFQVKVNGVVRLPRVELGQGRYANESLLLKTTSPAIDIEFQGLDGGSWLLDGLVLEPLGTLNEDFTFTRPWWNFAPELEKRAPGPTQPVETPIRMPDRTAPAAAMPQLNAAQLEAAADRLYDGVPTPRLSASARQYIERHQSSNWGGSCSGNMAEFNTPKLAAERAAEIKRGGYSAAFINGRQNRMNHLGILDEIVAFDRMVAEACHAQGLKAFDHIDFTEFWQAAYPVIFQHPDWALQDLRDGSHTRWCCVNNPGYRDFYAEYLERLTRAGIDGFQIDEVSFHDQLGTYCGCQYCRAKFEAETGVRFPEYWDGQLIRNLADPSWRLWQEWQKKCMVEFKAFLLERLHKINPDVIMLAYNTAIYRTSVRVQDMQDHARVCYVGTEGTDLVYAGAFNFFAQYRILSGYARWYGNPSWAHGGTSSDQEADFAAYLDALTDSGVTWVDADAFSWSHWAEASTWAEPIADVAVLLVSPSRDGDLLQGDIHSAETHGWCEALGLAGVQFEALPARHAQLSDLQKYRAVILPHAINMPRRLIEAVKQYVAAGGVAVVTGIAGRGDSLGSPLGDDAFFRSMGIREIAPADTLKYVDPAYYAKGVSTGVDRNLTPVPGRLPGLSGAIRMLNSNRFNIAFDPAAKQEILATFDDKAPAILSIPSGNGRYLYMAFLPAFAIHQPRLYQKYKWGKYMQPEVVNLMRVVTGEATGQKDRISVEASGVLSAAYRKGDTLWVRMLNISGINLPEGQPIGVVKPQYPPLGAIRIILRMPVKADVQLVSPDQKEALELKAVVEGQKQVITIPANAFSRFAFIRMKAAD